MDQKKFLIVGAGIAGVCISKHLVVSGQNVTVIDSGINRSSAVAAGMINPIVFRRMTRSWRVDEFIPYLEEFYTTFSKESGVAFFHPIIIRRMFSSLQERNFWLEKQELDSFVNYLSKVTPEDDSYKDAINLHGSGRIKKSSYVATTEFLSAAKSWLKEKTTYLEVEIDYSEIDPNALTYKGDKFDGIFFCEGAEVSKNTWFGKIPINPTKGETILIHSDTIPVDESLNRKCFILPVGNSKYKVGATYVWNTTNTDITSDGKQELIDNLSFLTNSAYSILNQTAGIRPTTLDRRPILGEHEDYKGLYVFNGLGTKGYMIAPLLAKEMVQFVLENKTLDPEVRYSRILK